MMVSIIIPFCTLNDVVCQCITNCLSINYSKYNLILLPDTKINLPLKFSNNPRIKIIETGNVTIARKRNKGLEYPLNASYYAFIDSDAYPSRDWLRNAIDTLNKFNDVYAVGGPSIYPQKDEFRRRVVGYALKSILGSGVNAKYHRENIELYKARSFLPTCNLIVKKEALEAIGRFTEDYAVGEDREFCNRMVKNKLKIIFCKNVVVFHRARPLFLPFIRQKVAYGYCFPKIALNYHNFTNFGLFVPPICLLVYIFLSVFCHFSDVVFSFWFFFTLFYFLFVLLEALRWSVYLKEVPFTCIAVIIGNLSQGAGTLLALLNIKINLQEFYRKSQTNTICQELLSLEA